MNTIGIIAAMDEEIDSLKEKMDVKVIKDVVGMQFLIGTFLGKNIIAVKCGVGKVNAAICTQTIIDLFGADYIINIGVAGGIHPEVKIGHIVISKDVVQHDFDVSELGYSLGTVPGIPAIGDYNEGYFKADEKLLEIALAASETMENITVHVGTVASGDLFVSNVDQKKRIWKNFNASCTEMEGAAIGQACYLNKIPFLVIRAISDESDGTAGQSFKNFANQAAETSIKFLERMIETMQL